ncbi:uncharacterized protein [Dysidea avara]
MEQSVSTMETYFTDTSREFGAVVADIAEVLNKCTIERLDKIKLVCLHLTTGQNIPFLSQEETCRIQEAKSIYDIFTVMRPYWNWSSHRLLRTIIKRVKSQQALDMLEKFENKIDYKMKLKDIHEHLRKQNVPIPSGYYKMTAIVDKDYSEITLEEYSEIEEFVHECLGQAQPSTATKSNSIQIVWYVADIAIDSLCSKAAQCKEAFILESFVFLEIGAKVIFDNRQVSYMQVDDPIPTAPDMPVQIAELENSVAAPLMEESTSVAESGIDHEISSCRGTVNHLRTENSQLQKEIKQLQIQVYTEGDLTTSEAELQRSIEKILMFPNILQLVEEELHRLAAEKEESLKNVEEELEEVKQKLSTAEEEINQYKQVVEEYQSQLETDEESEVPTELHLHETGTVIGYLQCMIIDSNGGVYREGLKAVPTETTAQSTRKDIEHVQRYIRKDRRKELVFSLHDSPNFQLPRQYYLDRIRELFKECSRHGAMIYYTGYGEEHTGNWCFKDGTITFQDILKLYRKYLVNKLLHIFTDCCYSGQWVVECAKCLDEMGIGACGHQTREKGILIKISASCQPDQKAATERYVNQRGFFYYAEYKGIGHYPNKRLSTTQTTYACDFTRTKCLQLEGPTSPCRLPDIPPKCSWKWQDVVAINAEERPTCLLYKVCGQEKGKDAWYIVLIKRDLLCKFKEKSMTEHIDVANYEYVVKSGWGKNPPEEVIKKVNKLCPSYCKYSID